MEGGFSWGGVEGWGEKAHNCNWITIKKNFLKRKNTIPSSFFYSRYCWLSQQITSDSGTRESTHLFHEPEKKGVRRLKGWESIWPEQSRYADWASNGTNLMETQFKVSPQLCIAPSQTTVGFFSGCPPNIQLDGVCGPAVVCDTLIVTPHISQVLHASGSCKALPSLPVPV